jgi:hypothetical protein
MPLEGHWKRINTPLRKTTRREGRMVAVVGGLFVVALVVVLFLAIQSGSSGSGSGCIDIRGTHAVGGATIHACGQEAARWCDSAAADRPDALGRNLRQECRDADYR